MRQPVPYGKYILLDRISVGGMAEVFKAKSFGVEGFEKVIAIKRILPAMGEDRDFIDMFIDEAKIAGQLAHANICQIFELGRMSPPDASHFIAMEYIWGKDLLQVFNRFKKLRQVMPPAMACYIASKVCEGLDYAHRKRDALGQPLNIVHRDCSPQNVLISYEGEVKLIDFGIAKAASRSSKTVAGVLKGKFGYMSPEQVRGLALDRRSDVFAIGTVLYECLTGERLFQCESDFSTLEKVRNVAIFRPRHFNKDIPEELERIVMKALSRDMDDRYQWASELQADLQQLLMKEDKVFAAKALGSWLKEGFAAELRRERELMEAYRRVGADGKRRSGSTPSPPPLPDDAVAAAVPSPRLRPSGQHRQADGDFDEDKPTEIFGELDAPEGGPDGDDDAGDATLEQPRNEVLVSSDAAPSTLSEEPTVSKELALQMGRSQDLPPLSGGSGEFSFGTTAAVPAIGRSTTSVRAMRRKSMLKDVAIGLGIAAFVLTIFAGAKYLFFDERPGTRTAEASSTGTIAITVPDLEPAEVHLNGHQVGQLEGGEAFTIESLAPGEYFVIVRRANRPDCVRAVDLSAKKLEVINCRFDEAAPRQARLVLAGELGGATVYVDGAQISSQAAAEPLLLAPGVDHEIEIAREGAPEHVFAVNLAAGQEQRHEVPAPPPPAPLEKADRDDRDDRDDKADEADEAERERRAQTRRERREQRRQQDTSLASQFQRATSLLGTDADGQQREASRRLAPEPEPEPEGAVGDDAGYLIAWTTPWARVLIDGRDTGKMTPIAPRAKIPLSPGKHKVTFVVGNDKWSYPVVIEAGETVKLRKELPVQD